MRKSLLVLAVLGSFAAPAAVMAAEAPAEAASDWTIPTSISFVSDYIFRGQSQTWGKPAAQISVELDHKSGFYAGFFGSNVSEKWLPGANLETDLYAGFRNTIGETGVGYDLGAIYYAYPGANWDESPFVGSNKKNKVDTAEVYGGMSYKWLSFKTGITLTEYWGWNKNNSANAAEPSNGGVADFNGNANAGVHGSTKGSYYYELNAAYEVVPTWTLVGQAGRQIINNSDGLDISYYKAGVSKGFASGWSVAGFYSTSSEPDAYKDFLSLANGTSKTDIAKDKFFVSISRAF